MHAHSSSVLVHVVALPYVRINRGARLKKVVVDRGLSIPEGLVVGEDPISTPNASATDHGVCLITQPMIDQLKR